MRDMKSDRQQGTNTDGAEGRVEDDRRLLRLDSRDNMLTVIVAIDAGERICVAGQLTTVSRRLPLGHKVAARAIGVGEKIIKYGVPIGSATASIEIGEHVHTHNLKSDYLPTYPGPSAARRGGGADGKQVDL